MRSYSSSVLWKVCHPEQYVLCRSKKDPAKTDFAAGPRVDSRSSSQRADTAVQDEFNQKLAQYGEEVALQQQETFVAALRDVQGNVQEPDTELSAQQILQQRQRQEDYIRRNAKHISPTLHARVQSNSVPAKPDTFSRSRESGRSQSGAQSYSKGGKIQHSKD